MHALEVVLLKNCLFCMLLQLPLLCRSMKAIHRDQWLTLPVTPMDLQYWQSAAWQFIPRSAPSTILLSYSRVLICFPFGSIVPSVATVMNVVKE